MRLVWYSWQRAPAARERKWADLIGWEETATADWKICLVSLKIWVDWQLLRGSCWACQSKLHRPLTLSAHTHLNMPNNVARLANTKGPLTNWVEDWRLYQGGVGINSRTPLSSPLFCSVLFCSVLFSRDYCDCHSLSQILSILILDLQITRSLPPIWTTLWSHLALVLEVPVVLAWMNEWVPYWHK